MTVGNKSGQDSGDGEGVATPVRPPGGGVGARGANKLLPLVRIIGDALAGYYMYIGVVPICHHVMCV